MSCSTVSGGSLFALRHVWREFCYEASSVHRRAIRSSAHSGNLRMMSNARRQKTRNLVTPPLLDLAIELDLVAKCWHRYAEMARHKSQTQNPTGIAYPQYVPVCHWGLGVVCSFRLRSLTRKSR